MINIHPYDHGPQTIPNLKKPNQIQRGHKQIIGTVVGVSFNSDGRTFVQFPNYEIQVIQGACSSEQNHQMNTNIRNLCTLRTLIAV